ncbi:hypothetical protein KM043_009255 [Ampulex compressa]|nr:hypothetical protein KM043_009255 [Ampulex compressa]
MRILEQRETSLDKNSKVTNSTQRSLTWQISSDDYQIHQSQFPEHRYEILIIPQKKKTPKLRMNPLPNQPSRVRSGEDEDPRGTTRTRRSAVSRCAYLESRRDRKRALWGQRSS